MRKAISRLAESATELKTLLTNGGALTRNSTFHTSYSE